MLFVFEDKKRAKDVFGTNVCVLSSPKAICSQCHKRHSPQDDRLGTSYELICACAARAAKYGVLDRCKLFELL